MLLFIACVRSKEEHDLIFFQDSGFTNHCNLLR